MGGCGAARIRNDSLHSKIHEDQLNCKLLNILHKRKPPCQDLMITPQIMYCRKRDHWLHWLEPNFALITFSHIAFKYCTWKYIQNFPAVTQSLIMFFLHPLKIFFCFHCFSRAGQSVILVVNFTNGLWKVNCQAKNQSWSWVCEPGAKPPTGD